MFDQQLFHFTCENCGEKEPMMLSRVLKRFDSGEGWRCAACEHVSDLEPHRAEIEKLRDIASELDKQARERGEDIWNLEGKRVP